MTPLSMRGLALLAIVVVGCSGPPENERSGPKVEASEGMEQLGSAALIPSRDDDHARALGTTGRELARSLETIAGVQSARVHLAALRRDPFADSDAPPPTASVLLNLRRGAEPLEDRKVQALVASAVPGLSPDRVAVVRVFQSAIATPELARVGPFMTTRDSAPRLRAALAVLASLNIALVALVLGIWARKRAPRERSARIARGVR